MSTAVLLFPPAPDPLAVREEPLYEVVDGVRVELPEMSIQSNLIKSDLHGVIWSHVRQHKLGKAVVETLFVLDPETNLQRRPDIAFVSKERWPLDREVPWEGDWEVVPDLCIEISSPSDLYHTIMEKVMEYLRYGVRQVWVLWPPGGGAQVFTRAGGSLLRRDQELDGSDILPGFKVGLSEILPAAVPARP